MLLLSLLLLLPHSAYEDVCRGGSICRDSVVVAVDSLDADSTSWYVPSFVRDKELESRLKFYFSTYSREGYRPTTTIKLQDYEIDTLGHEIKVFGSEGFGSQLFTPAVVEKIYGDIRDLLPERFGSYNLWVEACGHEISRMIPNLYNDVFDEGRSWGDLDYRGVPLTRNLSKPYEVTAGLGGRHMAVWASHGRYYSFEKGCWTWQRPALFCSVEDLLSPSIVLPFLIPMLENAGAIVFSPRERDIQSNRRIVDEDGSDDCCQVIVDNGEEDWQVSPYAGYSYHEGIYLSGENPYGTGTARLARTVGEEGDVSTIVWMPDLPQEGDYAVYVLYQSFEESVSDARYEVRHRGVSTCFSVNQQMGGGVWTYLGTFNFDAGRSERNCVILNNYSGESGVVSGDAARFGGGEGVVVRGDSGVESTSGLPCYMEGARYSVQMMGFDDSAYNTKDGFNDYADDINARSRSLNFLSGGSLYHPDTCGLRVPIELSVGVHTDAGLKSEGQIVGTLAINTEPNSEGSTVFLSGLERLSSADLAAIVQTNVYSDLTKVIPSWSRRELFHRNYSETRLPEVPSTIIEMFSHQNFEDMRYGHDPNFKFLISRAIYKGVLRFVAAAHGEDPIVQPLPVSSFAALLDGEGNAFLSWECTPDSLEPTAQPLGYVLYTQQEGNGFDNGQIFYEPRATVVLAPNTVYNFKVTAFNAGGESFPSEELAVMYNPDSDGQILIINGFDRLSGPAIVSTSDSLGFDIDRDIGVPYIQTMEYCGRQVNYDRYSSSIGASSTELQATLTVGNTFDYPFVHGQAISRSGIARSFCSVSRQALERGSIDLGNYAMVDLILGQQRDCGASSMVHYETFTPELRRQLEEYLSVGGRLLVSGSYLASDNQSDSRDYAFLRDFLHVTLVSSALDQVGKHTAVETNGLQLSTEPLKSDIIAPTGDSFLLYTFTPAEYGTDDATQYGLGGAGVAYDGSDYKVIALSFPFESITSSSERARLMAGYIQFMEGTH